jgi:MoaA/NifB/PqqE/SkfB family radical SAM enzyme
MSSKHGGGCSSLNAERVFLKLFGLKLISYSQLSTGQYVGSGILNPLIDRLSLIPVLYLQAKFYKQYKDLGEWNGKRVANPFAPPVGSRPQFRALCNLVKTHVLGRAFPLAMTFAVTYRCQCNCVHCSASHRLRENDYELTTQEAKQLIDDSLDLGISIIAFTGGEPLIRDDIFELISYVDQRKAMPLIFTNGLLLTDENIDKLVDAGLYTLFVSLDSTSAEEHDRLRGKEGLFNTAVEGLKKMKDRGVFVAISSYASRAGTENGMYRKMYKFAQELGVHNVILFDNVPTGRLMKDTSVMLTKEQREEILAYSLDIFRHSTIPPLSSQAWQTSIEGYLGGIGCLAANIQYYVSAYGDVAPCDFTPLSFGNIRNESLKSIWKKMIRHPGFKKRVQFCRMQNPAFRHFYIEPIPDDAPLPYPIVKLSEVDYLHTEIKH